MLALVGPHIVKGERPYDKIARCLWFDGQAEEAANFYASLLPDSQDDAVHRAPVRISATKGGRCPSPLPALCSVRLPARRPSV